MKLRVAILTSIAHFINDGSGIVYSTIYPLFIIIKNFNYIQISLASIIFLIFSAISSLFIGRLSDITNRTAFLLGLGIGIWGFALLLLGYSLFANDYSFLLLLISSAIGGIASSFYHPLGASLMSRYFDKNKGLIFGINGALGAIGRSSYPIIVTVLLSSAYLTTGDYLKFSILSIISFGVSLTILVTLKDNPNKLKLTVENFINRNKVDKNILILITFLTIIAILKGALAQGFITFLPTFLVKEAQLNYGIDVGLITSIALIGSVISQPLLGIISDVWGRARTMILTTLVGSIALLSYVYIYYIPLLSYLVLFIFGLFSFEAFTLLLTFVSDLIPKHHLSTANSIVWGLGITGGGALGPALVGLLSSVYNLKIAYVILSIVGLSGIIPIILTLKYKEKSRREI
jgi:MFS family permease